uniref:Uncharacterized protein n=1 Tax=Globodera rostochiensis TaxID=31243 RepID=A0A914I8B5_GLORO
MIAARLLQCARPLLVVVLVLLLCCCRPADAQQPDSKNVFACAKTGAELPGGLTIPMDNQIRIDTRKRDKDRQQLHVLLLNTTDEKPTMTVVAGPSCQSAFSPGNGNSSKCAVGKANSVSPKHGPNACPDAGGCKEFSFNCPMARDANLSASVFQINLKDFQSIDKQQCKGGAYIYIDNVRLLLDASMSAMGERCSAEGPPTNGSTNSSNTTTTNSAGTTSSAAPTTTSSAATTTTSSAAPTTTSSAATTTSSADTTTTNSAGTTTTNSSDTTTTNSSGTMTTGSTETMGSTETIFLKGGTMIIVLSAVGAGLFIAVVAAVVFVLCRRKGTSDDAEDAPKQVEEPDEKSSAEEEPPTDPKTEGVEVPDSAYSKGSHDEDGSTAADGSTA